MELKERPFSQFASNILNRNAFWQKLYMKPTMQKMYGYEDGGTETIETSQR